MTDLPKRGVSGLSRLTPNPPPPHTPLFFFWDAWDAVFFRQQTLTPYPLSRPPLSKGFFIEGT